MKTASNSKKKKSLSLQSLQDTLQDRVPRVFNKILKRALKSPILRKKLQGIDFLSEHSIEILLISKAKMADLNLQFRNKKGPTDVLSFEAPDVFRKQGVLGQILICRPLLKAQALRYHLGPEEELEILLVHGFLHLLGFDHEKGNTEANTMRRFENNLLSSKLQKGLIERAQKE
jgi:rRNA maturation RNase YbeY